MSTSFRKETLNLASNTKPIPIVAARTLESHAAACCASRGYQVNEVPISGACETLDSGISPKNGLGDTGYDRIRQDTRDPMSNPFPLAWALAWPLAWPLARHRRRVHRLQIPG